MVSHVQITTNIDPRLSNSIPYLSIRSNYDQRHNPMHANHALGIVKFLRIQFSIRRHHFQEQNHSTIYNERGQRHRASRVLGIPRGSDSVNERTRHKHRSIPLFHNT